MPLMHHIRNAALVALTLTAFAAIAQAPQYGPWGFDLTAMDRSVKPGDDFNRYASGAWLDRTEIPADRPMASLRYLMNDAIEARLHDLMEAAAKSPPATLEGKVGTYYKAFLDEDRLQRIGEAAVASEIETIKRAPDRAALTELMGRSTTDFY